MPFNDTGTIQAVNSDASVSDTCTSDISSPQDCHQGRDAAAIAGNLPKLGAGPAGFDLTRLDSNGMPLAIQSGDWSAHGSETAGTRWACVRDNHTGLVWEVKADDNGPRDRNNTYRWGGLTADGYTHRSTQGTYHGDWDALVEAGNDDGGLCGRSDWRVPSARELANITRDAAWFPNSVGNSYWSSTYEADESDGGDAWRVTDGRIVSDDLDTRAPVRLVSGRPATASTATVEAIPGQNRLVWLPNTTPDSRYTVDEEIGTVIDTHTGLMWRRCLDGLSGSDCAQGSATASDWSAALARAAVSTFAGYTDWRLPNIAEAHSLAAYDRYRSALNATIFPGATGSLGSSTANTDGTILALDGNLGGTITSALNSNLVAYLVRTHTPNVPPSPSQPVISAATSSSNTITWSAVPGAAWYRLYVATTESGPYSEILEAAGAALSYTHTDLPAGAQRAYRVVACTSRAPSTCSAQSRSPGVSTRTAPPAPTNLTATVDGVTVMLAWQGNSQAEHYDIWRGTRQDGTDRVRIFGQSGSLTGTSHSSTNTRRGTWYFWVGACNLSACFYTEAGVQVKVGFNLNDTGIITAGNADNTNSDNCTSDITAPQDCDQGRDAATLTKIGTGVAGFDFTKLASDGSELADQGTAWSSSGSEAANSKWSCVRDNHTGLVWETKTNDETVHDRDNQYTWNDINPAESLDLVSTSNADSGLCARTDWRIPTARELRTLIHNGRQNPAIATDHFPNITGGNFWSSDASNSSMIWGVDFAGGSETTILSSDAQAHLRLVSGSYESLSAGAVTLPAPQQPIDPNPNRTPDSRYLVNGTQGTVLDIATDLMWQQCVAGRSGTDCATGTATLLGWQGALEHAANSAFAGYTDWRLPSIAELRSLVAYDPRHPRH